MTQYPSAKMVLKGGRARLPADEAINLADTVLRAEGLRPEHARTIARHLVDADLAGVGSHGIVRLVQYLEQIRSGYVKRQFTPARRVNGRGQVEIDGDGGLGIPAMELAIAEICEKGSRQGVSVLAVRNVGHTGRLGAYAEAAAHAGKLIIIIGGGGRQNWRQVAPYGGRKALLPTNPYCIGIPGGDRGPVVIDFATSVIAGGWLQSARVAGAKVQDGAIIDKEGRPSREPADYFDGGAILPKGGPMGYGMAVVAEMICEAMLGPVTVECNWLVLAMDSDLYRARDQMQAAAEEVLAELRACPPAPGFDRVEVPGERERDLRRRNLEQGIELPDQTLECLRELYAAAQAVLNKTQA